MSLFDHIGFQSLDIERSLLFYKSCMPRLGLSIIAHSGTGFFVSAGERSPVPFLWIHNRSPRDENRLPNQQSTQPGSRLHLMFTASSQEDVRAFHRAALDAGGTENGAPAYQGAEEMGYYAALVFDPDGNTLEAGYRQRKR